jgi:hypothetical protein
MVGLLDTASRLRRLPTRGRDRRLHVLGFRQRRRCARRGGPEAHGGPRQARAFVAAAPAAGRIGGGCLRPCQAARAGSAGLLGALGRVVAWTCRRTRASSGKLLSHEYDTADAYVDLVMESFYSKDNRLLYCMQVARAITYDTIGSSGWD